MENEMAATGGAEAPGARPVRVDKNPNPGGGANTGPVWDSSDDEAPTTGPDLPAQAKLSNAGEDCDNRAAVIQPNLTCA